jgi:hypothetical protein
MKTPRLARGADQHRHSIANGLSNRPGNPSRELRDLPALSRRIGGREQESDELTTTTVVPVT